MGFKNEESGSDSVCVCVCACVSVCSCVYVCVRVCVCVCGERSVVLKYNLTDDQLNDHQLCCAKSFVVFFVGWLCLYSPPCCDVTKHYNSLCMLHGPKDLASNILQMK